MTSSQSWWRTVSTKMGPIRWLDCTLFKCKSQSTGIIVLHASVAWRSILSTVVKQDLCNPAMHHGSQCCQKSEQPLQNSIDHRNAYGSMLPLLHDWLDAADLLKYNWCCFFVIHFASCSASVSCREELPSDMPWSLTSWNAADASNVSYALKSSETWRWSWLDIMSVNCIYTWEPATAVRLTLDLAPCCFRGFVLGRTYPLSRLILFPRSVAASQRGDTSHCEVTPSLVVMLNAAARSSPTCFPLSAFPLAACWLWILMMATHKMSQVSGPDLPTPVKAHPFGALVLRLWKSVWYNAHYIGALIRIITSISKNLEKPPCTFSWESLLSLCPDEPRFKGDMSAAWSVSSLDSQLSA